MTVMTLERMRKSRDKWRDYAERLAASPITATEIVARRLEQSVEYLREQLKRCEAAALFDRMKSRSDSCKIAGLESRLAEALETSRNDKLEIVSAWASVKRLQAERDDLRRRLDEFRFPLWRCGVDTTGLPR